MGETIEVRRLGPDEWQTWREVRLAALANAPYAFGSSLAREKDLGETEWRGWLAPENGVWTVALLGERVVGLVGGYTAPDAKAVMLVAMWARPELRGRGIGDALVADVLAWARENSWSRVELRVADGNSAARRLFERHGFEPTGRRDTLESDPSVGTEILVREV
jgi:RimJ/RimL family protein N-acetyltransferase